MVFENVDRDGSATGPQVIIRTVLEPEPADGPGLGADHPMVPEPAVGQAFRIAVDGVRGDPGWGPVGPARRAVDNLAALQTLRTVQAQERPATADEQAVLGRWTSWGALPKVFDASDSEFAQLREQLHEVLDEREWSAARRTVLNAHYTSPGYATAMWDTLTGLGFEAGAVLEPGCGAGVFMGVAPAGARMTGVELDPVTAGIAAALYPQSNLRTESFADSGYPLTCSTR